MFIPFSLERTRALQWNWIALVYLIYHKRVTCYVTNVSYSKWNAPVVCFENVKSLWDCACLHSITLSRLSVVIWWVAWWDDHAMDTPVYCCPCWLKWQRNSCCASICRTVKLYNYTAKIWCSCTTYSWHLLSFILLVCTYRFWIACSSWKPHYKDFRVCLPWTCVSHKSCVCTLWLSTSWLLRFWGIKLCVGV
jgi:hypothetical protein